LERIKLSKYQLDLGEPKQLKDSADDITELGVWLDTENVMKMNFC